VSHGRRWLRGVLFGKAFDTGNFRAEQLRARRASVTLDGWPDAHEIGLVCVARSIRAALVVAGHATSRVEIVREPTRVRFDVEIGD
jgi:hypothetical protein